MNPGGPLRKEHRLIEKMISIIGNETIHIKRNNSVNPVFIDTAVDFMKIYADRTHHGKEEHILFETLTDMDLSTEDRSLMKELIADHVRFRNMTDNLVSLKNVFIKGRKENLSEIVETMDMLVCHYPEHVRKEEERFFPASLGYLSEEKQKLILAQFWDYDKNMIHIKYTQVVTKLLETSQR